MSFYDGFCSFLKPLRLPAFDLQPVYFETAGEHISCFCPKHYLPVQGTVFLVSPAPETTQLKLTLTQSNEGSNRQSDDPSQTGSYASITPDRLFSTVRVKAFPESITCDANSSTEAGPCNKARFGSDTIAIFLPISGWISCTKRMVSFVIGFES